jgi:bile acid:Na+ symporter, BASS family
LLFPFAWTIHVPLHQLGVFVMTLQALIPILMKSSMFLNVFAIGLEASTSEAAYLFRRPGELARAFLAVNVLMPLFAAILALVFNLNLAVEIALVALAISPVPPLIPRKVAKATSSGSYAIGLLVALGVLAVVFVPIALEILEQVFKVPLRMSSGSIAALVFMTILLPIGFGVAVRALLPNLAERLARPVSQIAGIGLLACLVVILISAAPAIWTLIGNGTLVALAAFVLVGLAIGHFLGGPEPENRAALAISTASRHPGIAAAVAAANFPDQKLVTAALLLYLLVSGLVSAPYQSWIKRRLANAENQPKLTRSTFTRPN